MDAIFAIWSVWFLEQTVSAIEVWNDALFKKFLFLYLLAIVIFYPVMFLLRHWTRDFVIRSQQRLYDKYVKNYILMDNNDAERIWTWKIIAILDRWIENRAFVLLKQFFRDWTRFGFKIIFSLIYISSILWWKIILILWLWIIAFLLVRYLNKFALLHRIKRREWWHTRMKAMVRVIMSKFEILQSQKIDHEIKTLNSILSIWYKSHMAVNDYVKAIFYIPLFVVWLVTVYFVRTYWTAVISSWIWFWQLTALLIIMWLVWSILNDLLDFYRGFTKERVNIQKVLDVFNDTHKQLWYSKWNNFLYEKWNIEVESMSYWYNKMWTVFNDFSLSMKWSKKTALVWVSGSWKSTLVKLISWYIRPDKWTISIDWQLISELSLQSYYSSIWYLTQEPSVFDWTIRENLFYAIDWSVSDDTLNAIIAQSKCEFIYDLPHWIDTEIGERWVRLSWWQRQRLAIAKIFLKDPKIIILDEPTSALDSFSEEAITQAMNNLFEGRTVIIIAHRLQTVKHADDIIVLDEWKIIERWNHNDLVALWWSYATMLELQSWF